MFKKWLRQYICRHGTTVRIKLIEIFLTEGVDNKGNDIKYDIGFTAWFKCVDCEKIIKVKDKRILRVE